MILNTELHVSPIREKKELRLKDLTRFYQAMISLGVITELSVDVTKEEIGKGILDLDYYGRGGWPRGSSKLDADYGPTRCL